MRLCAPTSGQPPGLCSERQPPASGGATGAAVRRSRKLKLSSGFLLRQPHSHTMTRSFGLRVDVITALVVVERTD
jgi:hypothetical protein